MSEQFFQRTVPETEIIGQFHGDPEKADLVLFMAGNQFVVMDQLVEAFKSKHSDVKEIFYVTIPPGQLLQWTLKGGIEINAQNSLANSGFKLSVLPDVYTTVNKGHMDSLAAAGLITRYYTYAHNQLVLMTKSDDPLAGQTISAQQFYDLLADPNVGISEPDIITQGIERHFWQMYTETSKVLFPDNQAVQELKPTMFDPQNLPNDPAESLRRIIYYDKVNSGKTLITSIHHLETPAFLRSGAARVGGVWITEVLYQQNRLKLNDLAAIQTDDKDSDGKFLDRRDKVNYLASIVDGTVAEDHKQAALDWIEFLRGAEAQAILQNVGFIPATSGELAEPFVYPDSESNSRVANY